MSMDPAVLRSVERILAVAIGGVSIFLGDRLFLALPQQRDSSGSVRLPWNISIALSRVGPGIFFALFGAAVVALGLRSAVSVNTSRSIVPGGTETETTSVSGIGLGAAASGETPEVRRLRARAAIRFLNTLPLRGDLASRQKQEVTDQLGAIKLGLMRAAWGPDWGDDTAFAAWVENGATDPVPAALHQAAAIYRAGLGGTP
jgi:hypothetical protein